MFRHNLEEFKMKARSEQTRVLSEGREMLVQIAVSGYKSLLEATEASDAVDSGAYRLSHEIVQDTRVIFEAPDKPNPNIEIPSQKQKGLPPIFPAADIGAVELAVRSNLEADSFGFRNQRFYADDLEHGTSRLEPRLIYEQAAASTAAAAEQIAQEKD